MSRKFETLYKVKSNGKGITRWSIESQDASYTIRTGQVNGTIQTFVTDVTDKCRSDTLAEQADKLAMSAWTLKRKSMYPTIIDAQCAFFNKSLNSNGYKPMLAKTFDRTKPPAFIDGALIQPKLDGERCVAKKIDGEVTLYARSGDIRATTPHINEQLDSIMLDGEILDGEIYKHGMELDRIVSLTHSTKNLKDTSELEFWIYDFPRIVGSKMLTEDDTYRSRLDVFYDRNGTGRDVGKNLVGTPTACVFTLEEIDSYHHDFVSQSFEGAILRHPNSAYINSRTSNLLKVKEFQDAEYEIVSVREGKGKMKGAAIFTCAVPNGRSFDVKMTGEISKLRYWFEHPETVIGKALTVKFFALTKYGVPRFPVGVSIRGVA